MADYISAELAATCAALGYYNGKKYYLEKNSIDVIKDLIKYLKRDDDTHTVRRYLGQTKLLQSDLIKIFTLHFDKLELWNVLLRLIINLTSPALLIYNEQMPMEKTMRNFYLQIISHLQSYKIALADDQVWKIVNDRLIKVLSIDNMERGEENELIIDRILALIRNVLQVPPDENEKRTDNDATVHDQVLFTLHASGIVDILLFIANSTKEQQYHMQILEIISLMLRDQSASQLASAGLQRSTIEKEKDEAQLLSIRQKEKLEKFEKIKKYTGARHSRFGGTYVIQNMKAIGDNQMLCHKPYEKVEALEFNSQKTKVKKPKNKLAMQDTTNERRSALSVRLFLREFCVEFLNGVYNPIMKYARSYVISDVQCDSAESSCYLWVLRFFMEFNRCYKFEVKYVSETISTEIFYIIQRQMNQYYEMIVTDKKRIPIWSYRLHLALKAYKELLHTLMAMDKSPDKNIRESSKVIKSNVFYVPEYRETIFSQFLNFDELKMSRKYLIDLVTTAHIFLKMLEQYCAKGQRSLIVQKLKKKKRHKSRKQKSTSQKEVTTNPSLDERWDDLAQELSAVMQDGGSMPEMIPFDAALDTPIDEQKSDAMKRIQKLLRLKHFENAVGLLRACREVWPENDSFGRADIPPEEEFLALREIFFADLGVQENDFPTQQTSMENDFEDNFARNDEYEDDEEYDDGEDFVTEETDFKLNEFVQRFANIRIVKALAILLREFDKNTNEVNHYVTKMLHRIAWDCKMPAMIFQASIFRTFQKILESKYPEHKELQKFAIFIIRRFIEVAQKNRKSYMELLFWKNTRDATQIVEGYDAETNKKKVSRGVWTEEEEDELRTLFMEHQTNKPSEDLVDWILKRLINETRTRRGVIKKLKEMCLVVNSKAVRNEIQKRLPKEWSEEEIAQLTELWEQLREDEDPVELIYNGLRIKRTKSKIKEKLLELGLAKDRRELYKKRSRKSNHGKSSWETQSASNSDEEDQDSEEESRKSSGRNDVAPSKPTKKRTTTTTRTRMTKQGGRRSRGKRNQKSFLYTDAQLSGLLKDVIEGNMKESLEWIKESLEDALEDRDEESSEGIPLVPLTDYSSNAMDSRSFQKLLRAMGIVPPADEQEIYWRIPSNMLASTIRKRCKLIADSLEGKFIVEEDEPSASNIDDNKNDSTDESDDDEGDVFENVKRFFASKEPVPSTSRESDVPPSDTEKPEKSNKRDKIGDDTVEPLEKKNEENQEEETGSNFEEIENVKKVSKGRHKVLSDSSESETEIERRANEAADEGKRNRSQTSDAETPLSKRPRLLDSDEDLDEPFKVETLKKSKITLVSDNEEDNPEEISTRNKSTSSRIIDSDEEESVTEKKGNSKATRKIISDDEEEGG